MHWYNWKNERITGNSIYKQANCEWTERLFLFNRMRRYNVKEIKKDPFDEYIKNLPPTRKELGQAWQNVWDVQILL